MIILFDALEKNISRLLLSGMLFALSATSYSQSSNDYIPKINIPTSPEAALLGRFGDIPVGYYTGTADISIPLYLIKEDGVEIPITLNYHSSGIKVEDQATWVGLGWDLSPEGSIVQEVRGKSDEVDMVSPCDGVTNYNMFLQRFDFVKNASYAFLPQFGRTAAPNTCLFSDPLDPPYTGYEDPYCAIDALLRGIGQPDIYSYSFNGHSGKFYLNPITRLPVIIDKNYQVYFDVSSSGNGIVATTLDGTKYNFGAIETAHGGIVGEYTGKTYKLSSITLLNGKSVNFNYIDNTFAEIAYNEYANVNNFSTTSTALSIKRDATYHSKKTLINITTSEAIIDFNLENREDINVETTDNVKRLKSIDITSRVSNKRIKTIEFSYSYFPYNGSSLDPYITAHLDAFGKRLKLESVKVIGYAENGTAITTNPPYLFDYDLSVIMPLKNSFAKDFWGYYNGVGYGTLLPNLDFFDYFYDPQYQAINVTLTYPYVGSNRYTDNTKAGAYMLKKITYPTGGYTEFGYEPNCFSNQFIPNKAYLESSFISKHAESDCVSSVNDNKQFDLGSKTKIHFENRINNGSGNLNGLPALTRSQMAGSYIKFYKFTYNNNVAQTTLIKQWDLDSILNVDFQNNGGKFWSEDLYVDYDPDPSPYFCYHVAVSFPVIGDNHNVNYASTAGVSSHFSYYDKTGIDTMPSIQCGMRIKSIKSYSQAGSIISNKLINYYDGKLLNRFRPLTAYDANHEDVAGVTNGIGFEYIAFYKKIMVSGNNFGTNGGNLIGYGKVEEIELSNDVAKTGKKVFSYNNSINKTFQDCPNIPNLRNGLISKEEIYDNSNNLLTEKIYCYQYMQPFPDPFICINVVPLSGGLKVPCNLWYDPTPFTTIYYDNHGKRYLGSQYGYNVYTINSEWSKLQSLTTKQYLNGNALTTIENYMYNTEGSLDSVTTINSKNDTLRTKYYYPLDGATYPDQYMVMVHNTGTPVITEKYNGTTLISRQRTLYSSFPSVTTMLPQAIYTNNTNGNEVRRVTIDSYNSIGNATQYTEENNISNSYLYGYNNTYPIAETKNATTIECGYTGFENHESNSFPIPGYANIEYVDDAFSGRKALKVISEYGPGAHFEVGNNALSHSGYKASVWVKGPRNACLHIQVDGQYSTNSHATNTETSDGWHLLEVELPREKIEPYFSDLLKIGVFIGNDGGGNAIFDDLRFYPMDAQMTTYTYDPLIGVTSVSDINNKPSIYKYDAFNRLWYVTDYLGDILKKYEYHYKTP